VAAFQPWIAGASDELLNPVSLTSRRSSMLILLIIVLVLLFGGGGGYYGYSRWGYGGGLGIFGTVLLIVLVLYLLGMLR
jgi:hypothetical protein